MQNVIFDLASVNIEALDAALRAALGDAAIGVSTGHGKVIANLTDEATPEQIKLARRIVEAHDPNELTPQQEQRIAYAAERDSLEGEVGAFDLTAPLNSAQLEQVVRLMFLRSQGV